MKKTNNWLDQYDEGGPTGKEKEKETKSLSQEDYVNKYTDLQKKLDQERKRVEDVRKNVIPSAQALDKADSELRVKHPEAFRIFQQSRLAKTPKELKDIIKKYPEALKNVLPNQGNYNLLLSNPDKYTADDEIYCTPYGCFTYQKAGAKDVPTLSGNFGFVEGAAKGTIPFQEVKSSEAEPGDMAIIYGQTMMDYRDPSKGYGDRPHHTTIYAGNMKKDPKGNVTAYDMYNAHEGNRLFFQKETRDKTSNKDSGYKFYRYTGKVPQYEKELQGAYSDLASIPVESRQVSFPQDELELQPSSYLQSLPSQEYGGWLDELDEYRRGGQKGLRKFTSKNIQSSINTLFSRNYDLFGPSGKKYYSPLVKFFDGGFNQGNALPGATQSTDWSMMANPNAVDYRTQAYPNASNPTMMQGPAAPTVTDKLTPEMGLDYKQKFDNPLFGGGKLANLTRGLMPWATQLGNQDDYKAMQDKAFASTNANAVFRKDDQKNLGTHTMDTYGIDTMRPNQVGMKVFGQGLAYENQNISRYGGENNWLDRYDDGGNTGNEPVATYTDYKKKGEVKPYQSKSQKDYDYRKKMYNDSLQAYNISNKLLYNADKYFKGKSPEDQKKIMLAQKKEAEELSKEINPSIKPRNTININLDYNKGTYRHNGKSVYVKEPISEQYTIGQYNAPTQVVLPPKKDYTKSQWDFNSPWGKTMRYYDGASKLLYSDVIGNGKVQRFYESNYEGEKTPMDIPYAEWEKSFQKEEGGSIGGDDFRRGGWLDNY